MIENWKPVPGYEGLYEVSDQGRVMNSKTETIIKPYKNSNGYLVLSLNKGGVIKQKYLHRIISLAFIPNPDNLPCVNHRDEDKMNNSIDNLEWCSYKYNNNYGTARERSLQTKIDNGVVDSDRVGLDHNEHQKRWYHKNKDKHKRYTKKYYETHKEEIKEYITRNIMRLIRKR